MTRSVCCLALVCLFAGCVPQKAVLVDEVPVTEPKETPETVEATQPDQPADEPLMVREESGMRVPDLTRDLPDQRDMTPTVPRQTTGSPVIATPPRDDAKVSE